MIKALVVDDDETVRLFLTRLLKKKLAVEVVEAENGMAALNLLEKEFPQIIFLDIMMPVMNGLDFLKKLRENPYFNQVPVVMLTAVTDKNIIQQSVNLGIIGYLLKPFDLEKTLERLSEIINKRRDELSRVRPKISAIKQEAHKPILFMLDSDLNFVSFFSGVFGEQFNIIAPDPDKDFEIKYSFDGDTYFVFGEMEYESNYGKLVAKIKNNNSGMKIRFILFKVSNQRSEYDKYFDSILMKSYIEEEIKTEFGKVIQK